MRWYFDLNSCHTIINASMKKSLNVLTKLKMMKFKSNDLMNNSFTTLYCVALVSLKSRTIRAHSSPFVFARPITPLAAFNVDDPFVLCRSRILILQSNFIFNLNSYQFFLHRTMHVYQYNKEKIYWSK